MAVTVIAGCRSALRELDAGLPDGCPHCGGGVDGERVEAQWQVDIPPVTPIVTKFNVAARPVPGLRSAGAGPTS